MIGFVVTLCFALAFIFGLRAMTGYRGLSDDARREYHFRREDGLLDETVSEAQFVSAYRSAHGPRGAIYFALTLIFVALMTWPLLVALEWGYEYLWRWSGQPREFEPGYLVWQFILFGGLIAGWAGSAFLGARLYYSGVSGSLEDELSKTV